MENTNKYKGEVFAPENYSFEYLFATTLAGQPLAWMEGTNLPEEAFTLREHTEAYKKFQHDMHSGTILPIGDEPSGRSWTGFQSLKKDRGYLIVYREKSSRRDCRSRNLAARRCHCKMYPTDGTRQSYDSSNRKERKAGNLSAINQ